MKSMETAPKDGTHILGYGLHFNDYGDIEPGFCEVFYSSDLNGWYNILHNQSELVLWDDLPDVGCFKI